MTTLPIVDRHSSDFFRAFLAYGRDSAANVVIGEFLEVDRDGRRVRYYSTSRKLHDTLVSVETLHRTARAAQEGRNYRVRNWQHPEFICGSLQGEDEGKIAYFATLRQARAHVQSLIS